MNRNDVLQVIGFLCVCIIFLSCVCSSLTAVFGKREKFSPENRENKKAVYIKIGEKEFSIGLPQFF